MVIYSDESDYESSWRRVDAMFDIPAIGGRRSGAFDGRGECIPIEGFDQCGIQRTQSINRNYRTLPKEECRTLTREECVTLPLECKDECRTLTRDTREECISMTLPRQYRTSCRDAGEECTTSPRECRTPSRECRTLPREYRSFLQKECRVDTPEECRINTPEECRINTPEECMEISRSYDELVCSIVKEIEEEVELFVDEEEEELIVLPTKIVYPQDVGPYMGSLNRRDKRRRPEKRDSFLFSPKRDSTVFSSANSLSSQCGLRRANTICTSGDVNAYLRNKCNRDSALSQGSETMSCKRNSKSTFDSGFESGLSDILDEILGATQYDTVMEESPKSKWASFKGKLSDTFVKSKRAEINDAMSDSSDLKMTRWTKLQQFVRFRLAKVSQHDLDMGGFEDAHWRSLEPRQFHRGTRRTQSFVKWKTPRER